MKTLIHVVLAGFGDKIIILENEKIEAYLKCVQLFIEANGIQAKKQVPVLLIMIGSTMYALLSNLVSPEKPNNKLFENLTAILCCRFDRNPLVITERFHFHRHDQAGKNISHYLVELRCLMIHCNFGEYLEQALRHCLVCGIYSENTQKCLLSEANLLAHNFNYVVVRQY